MENNKSDKTVKKMIYLMQRDESVDAPQDALQWSKNIFRARSAQPKKSFIEKVFAVLQVDLAPDKAVFGERSASAAQSRQMLFEAGETGIDLRVKETEKGLEIYGQILGEGFENASVKLGDFETIANRMSEFKFSEIPKGVYGLNLRGSEKEIVIEDLDFS